jgi:MFS family permease
VKSVKYFYVYGLVMSVQLFTPIVVLYFQDLGLSLSGILALQSVFVLTIIVGDIPTSMFADAWSRKGVLALASVMALGGTMAFYMARGYAWLLVGEVMWGLCAAAIMGTDTAYVYDILAKEGLESKASRVLTNGTSLTLAGAGLGSVFGSILASFVGFQAVFLYNTVFFVLGLVMALLLEEGRPSSGGRATSRVTPMNVLRSATGSLIRDRGLVVLAIDMAVLTAVVRAANWHFQPLLREASVPIAAFGVIFALINLAPALLIHLAPGLDKRLGSRMTMWTSRLALTLLLVALAFTRQGIVLAAFMVLLTTVSGIRRPLYRTYISKRARSEERATVLSFPSLAGNLLFTGLGPLSGWVSDTYGMSWGLLLLVLLSGGLTMLLPVPRAVSRDQPVAAVSGHGR